MGKAYGRMVRGRFVRDVMVPVMLGAYAPDPSGADDQNIDRIPGGSLAGNDSMEASSTGSSLGSG